MILAGLLTLTTYASADVDKEGWNLPQYPYNLVNQPVIKLLQESGTPPADVEVVPNVDGLVVYRTPLFKIFCTYRPALLNATENKFEVATVDEEIVYTEMTEEFTVSCVRKAQ